MHESLSKNFGCTLYVNMVLKLLIIYKVQQCILCVSDIISIYMLITCVNVIKVSLHQEIAYKPNTKRNTHIQ